MQLQNEVRRKIANVHVLAGRTAGDRFYLHSHQTFSLPECDDVDAVVVGLTFSPALDDVKIDADISGEQTGDLIFSLPTRKVANARQPLMEATHDLARTLSESVDVVAAALSNLSRRVE